MAELLSRQGPLAHVWLASNYDRKLSKLQLLSTNIIASSNIISTRQIQSAGDTNSDTITLRLSGQLLLGIVRIYSRKTKYLLDDVNECLYKLKSSFRYASGASLGSNTTTVNLPPPRTTITNFSKHLMQDQVTELDLFYQEDLNLDDDAVAQTNHDMLFSQVSSLNHSSHDASEIDRSIELARRQSGPQPDMDMDMDLDLDFDLDLDQSIEQGRDAQAPMLEADQSVLDLSKGPNSPILGSDDLGLGEPLETIEDRSSVQPQETSPITPPQESIGPARRTRLVGVTNEGVIKTTKRKLIVDNAEELQRGLPNEILKSIQHLQTHGRFTEETLTLNLTENEKLQLIEELASPASSKRRKIWNLDHELRQRCVQLSNQEQQGSESPDHSMSFDLDNSLDFDLSLPGLEPDNDANTMANKPTESPREDDDNTIDSVKGTTQIAEHLRKTFFEQPTIKFDELMDKDMTDGDNVPLGAVHKASDTVKVSQRREATKCFFELLVLASHNCVSLEQDETNGLSQLGKNLTIRPRDNLVSRFL